jgi:XTP/dITP diphosphohydrolase
MTKLILATNNQDKIREISDILKDLGIEILTAGDFEDFPDVEETGTTLSENAILKAKAVWDKYALPCVADDTGLEVDYLDGAPGVYSARYAGENCTYDDNNEKLLKILKDVPAEKRIARFKTAAAFVDSDGEIQTVEGILEGSIATEKRGSQGFGYDPLFIVGDTDKHLAELTLEEKNRISHRARAIEKVAELIRKSLAGG